MSLFEVCQWIQDSSVGTSIRESVLMFPLIETAHVIGLTVSVGFILMTDLRLIGAILRREPFLDVHEQLRPWMITGFVSMFLSGALLFWSEAAKCYTSPTFRIKIIFLILAGVNALVFETTLGRRAASWNLSATTPTRAKLTGWASLICWSGVIIFGRWTAYGMK
jgi:hypothetical protein